MKRKYLVSIVLIILYISFGSFDPVSGLSTAVKAKNDYVFTLDHLRDIRIIIENFGDDNLKKKYNEVKDLFNRAASEFYGQKFSSSYEKFYNLKQEMILLMESLVDMYIKRSQEILDSTQKESFDIIIKYGKGGGLWTYFRKPFDPLNDIKAYKEDEYHFFFDKEIIERYLRAGYETLMNARNKYKNPDLEIIRNKKTKTPTNLSYMIDMYSKIISDCRLAKQYGIEIHKLMKINQVGDILQKYNIPSTALDPVFDDRIPEDYKVDANDNMRLIHEIEKKRLSKILNGKQETGNKKK